MLCCRRLILRERRSAVQCGDSVDSCFGVTLLEPGQVREFLWISYGIMLTSSYYTTRIYRWFLVCRGVVEVKLGKRASLGWKDFVLLLLFFAVAMFDFMYWYWSIIQRSNSVHSWFWRDAAEVLSNGVSFDKKKKKYQSIFSYQYIINSIPCT